MNTSKQVNVMIGLLFLAFLAFGAYILNEPNRAAIAEEGQQETVLHRGAELFVNNCRTCHGLEGEGGIGFPLNTGAFLIFEEGNEFGAPETPDGEARAIRTFLFNTIACGRVGSAMPLWSERYGGPMSETQINYLVDMITTPGGWEVVAEVGHEHDVEAGTDPSEVVFGAEEAAGLSVTMGNCGQYQGAAAAEFRGRDPFVEGGGEATPEPLPEEPEAQVEVAGVLVGTFYQNTCATCHGTERQGGVGLPLTPTALTQPDEFYVDTILNGRENTAMPPWAGTVTPEEAQAIVTFLKNVEP